MLALPIKTCPAPILDVWACRGAWAPLSRSHFPARTGKIKPPHPSPVSRRCLTTGTHASEHTCRARQEQLRRLEVASRSCCSRAFARSSPQAMEALARQKLAWVPITVLEPGVVTSPGRARARPNSFVTTMCPAPEGTHTCPACGDQPHAAFSMPHALAGTTRARSSSSLNTAPRSLHSAQPRALFSSSLCLATVSAT